MRPSRSLTATILAYALLLVGMLRWHFSHGPLYHQATLGLLVIFSLCAALAGLLSVWAALGALHWARRASVFIAGTAVLTGFWLLFSPWNRPLNWQMVVLGVVQIMCLVVGLGVVRLFGFAIIQEDGRDREVHKQFQFSVRDLFMLTGAFAIFFAILGTVHPVNFSVIFFAILVSGGCCSAFTAASACWICFSKRSIGLRLVTYLLVAPIGGGVYSIASRYVPLMYSSAWYAGVTSLQMLFMILPLVIARMHGFRFVAANRHEMRLREAHASGRDV